MITKKCKEVVLKEFGYCHKHYADYLASLQGNEGYTIATDKCKRVTKILSDLQSEAALAKKRNTDLYQRKNKLIPKFEDHKSAIYKRLNELAKVGYGVPVTTETEIPPSSIPSSTTAELSEDLESEKEEKVKKPRLSDPDT